MTYTLLTDIDKKIFRAKIVGQVDKNSYIEARANIVAQFQKSDCKNILLDLRECRLIAPIMDIYAIASTTADVIPAGTRYAVLSSAETLDPEQSKFGEDVAVNRGAILKNFHEMDQALAWLNELL